LPLKLTTSTVEPVVPAVSTTPTRREQAMATRSRIVRRALELVGTNGLTATTMAAVASASDVAVQTVYFTFHTKDELLQAVFELAFVGDEPQPEPVDWRAVGVGEPDGARLLAEVVRTAAVSNARIAPILPAIHAVAHEPSGQLPRRHESRRREELGGVIDLLARRRQLADGVTRRRAVDVLLAMTGPDAYRALVLESGWTPRNWSRWVTDLLSRELVRHAPTTPRTAPATAASPADRP
jgi:AcrR family transcriptional regulator